MRLATWNVNSLKARLERVLAWTERNQPDILCMQETKLADDAVPLIDFAALGYEVAHHGSGTWNGVAIASRVGIDEVVAGLPETEDWTDEGGRFLTAVCGGVRVASVYVPNGRVVGSEFYDAKLEWLDHLDGWVRDRNDPADSLALCGDFNVAPTDNDVWDPAAAHGATHVSVPERERVARLVEWGHDRRPAPVPPGARLLHVVGLPGGALPQELRDADRPRPGHRAARRPRRRRGARP